MIESKKWILGIADVLKKNSGGRKPWMSQETVEMINEEWKFKSATDE